MSDKIDINNLTAEDIYQYFLKANLPCQDFVVYFKEYDLTANFGKYGYYISKVNFDDAHIPSNNQFPCKLEVFRDAHEAAIREENTKAINIECGYEQEYCFLKGPVLLRLPLQLSVQQAAKYEAVLDDLLCGKDPTDKFKPEPIDPSTVKEYVTSYDAETLRYCLKMNKDFKRKYAELHKTELDTKENIFCEDIHTSTNNFTYYFLGEIKYRFFRDWIFKENDNAHYHFACEEGFIDNGYMYASKHSYLEQSLINSFQGVASASQYNRIAKKLESSQVLPITPLSEIDLLTLDPYKGACYIGKTTIQGITHNCGVFLLGAKESLYVFIFLLDDSYTFDAYHSFLYDFARNVELI